MSWPGMGKGRKGLSVRPQKNPLMERGRRRRVVARSDEVAASEVKITSGAINASEEIRALVDVGVTKSVGDADTRGAASKEDAVLAVGEVEDFVVPESFLDAEGVAT